ncbi:hypothetical protein [Tumebacillus permanentifrigoris]|uniref:Uncharacterized protein n=1 Tax=Tumebacillus permanentifrigoris TaxID=378543 RepID=A0A316D4J0_9BACL|nr:hypothetical protein [Tumebacillus permanentifrigoris]PWK07486.1 hypothetical protein C7459_11785 [Tumebacillus permanentifrigoris]
MIKVVVIDGESEFEDISYGEMSPADAKAFVDLIREYGYMLKKEFDRKFENAFFNIGDSLLEIYVCPPDDVVNGGL